MVKIFNPNAYDLEVENGVGANSLSITSKDFIKKTTGVVAKATA